MGVPSLGAPGHSMELSLSVASQKLIATSTEAPASAVAQGPEKHGTDWGWP